MMQMHYFYEISKSGLVSRTKGSGWPESRDGLALFTEMPRRVLLGNSGDIKREPGLLDPDSLLLKACPKLYSSSCGGACTQLPPPPLVSNTPWTSSPNRGPQWTAPCSPRSPLTVGSPCPFLWS